ncbi:MAG: 4Fe-4S dicluster domain-containing protein [Ignisphaera sp.]
MRGNEVFVGSYGDLKRLIVLIKEFVGIADIVGYKVFGGSVIWGSISDVNDLPLNVSDIQGPGFFRITKGTRFRHSVASPKVFLNPSEQLLLMVFRNYDVESVVGEIPRVVLFGIKPCDVKSIEVLDSILGNHPLYAKARKAIAGIVVEECLEPGETCFCGATDSGPNAGKGFDISYAKVNENSVIFRYGSNLGKRIIDELGLKEAERDIVEEYVRLVENAKTKTVSKIPKVVDVQKALYNCIEDISIWAMLSKNCVGCGNCNYVCPTCFCLEFEDEIVDERYAKRVAKWIGCLTYTYGQVAGGHFRPQLYMRYRHFVLHKFLFYPKQIGLLGCVGCGRCITWCPLGVDLRKTLSEIVERCVKHG